MNKPEMQGPYTVPAETEDVVFIRGEDGRLMKLEVPDDADDD